MKARVHLRGFGLIPARASCVLLAAALTGISGHAMAQGEAREGVTWPEFNPAADTNASRSTSGETSEVSRTFSGIGTATGGATIVVSGFGANTFEPAKQQVLTIPEADGDRTYITYTAGGGLSIQEGGRSRATIVTPRPDGSVRIKTPDNGRYIVRPDGRIRSLGRKSRDTYITTSRDGSTVTIWGKDGRTYKVPMPGK